jgi:CRP-like cAMP-binding protein
MDILSFLDQAQFFKGISRKSREALARVCIVREHTKSSVLFRESEPGDAIFLLVSGRIGLHKLSRDGHEVVIKVIQPGEVFAEVVLFEEKDYPVTAICLTDAIVLLLFRRDLLALLAQEDFRNDFIAMLLRKQRYLADKIQQITTQDVEARLRTFLREQYGQQEQIRVEINKKQLAGAIGTTPETLSRLLHQLSVRECLFWRGRTITTSPTFWK